MKFTIGKLAEAGGVGVETIRYYQRRGMMSVPDRGEGEASGGIRRYGTEDLKRLNFIRSAKSAGFTLAEITELLALEGQQNKSRVRQLALQRIKDLDQQIEQMVTARSALFALARECEASMDDQAIPCPILRAFEP